MRIRIQKLSHFSGELPQYQSERASGLDVRAQLQGDFREIPPGKRTLIPTGLVVEIPHGYEIQVRPRSGLAARQGLSVLNSPGTIDADYRGEVKILLANLGTETIRIADQDRIAQWVLAPVLRMEWDESVALSITDRGAGGFGSTGL